MAKLPLRIGQEHVAKLARMHDPVGAVEELIWNALDADAEHVQVELDTNELGGVERVVVRDDGTGITPEQCAECFQTVGTSWKRAARTSPVKKRALHGMNGQGRIRAFALGTELRWTSVSRGAVGSRRIVIEADSAAKDCFHVSDPEPVDQESGTTVELLGCWDLQKLTDPTAVHTLTAALALYLEAYPEVEVVYDGARLDPAGLKSREAEYALEPSPGVAASPTLKTHFRSRAEERRQEIVRKWQAEGIYPYRGEPADRREQTERETFDTVATTVARHIPQGLRTHKVTLAFLRSVLAHEPSDVLRILEDVFALTKQEQDTLARLLDRTPLSSLVKASTRATSRLDFLAGLEHLVFDPEVRGHVTERTQLHKVLEHECWVFGEEYALHVSDRSLDEVLRRHCALLGREAPEGGPVLREDGRSGRVDLMLSRAAQECQGQRHHLVVELKRPSVVLGMAEFGQLSSYVQAVMKDARFQDPRVVWDFWLVGNEMRDDLRALAQQSDRAPGCVVSATTYRVWVRTWGDIIKDCEQRLRFYRDHLEYQSSTEHAMDYLVHRHPDVGAELAAQGVIDLPAARAATDEETADLP